MKIKTKSKDSYYYDVNNLNSLINFSSTINLLIKKFKTDSQTLVILCIGTDRATGDCLGPIIGYKLKKLNLYKIPVYGTLEKPVHAKNIDEIVTEIHTKYLNPFIIAIDACLGKMNHIGYVNVGKGSINPGAGVNKKLNPVGNLYITGIVNFSGFMDMLILQNTRLNTVMKMADFIAFGIKHASHKLQSPIKKQIK